MGYGKNYEPNPYADGITLIFVENANVTNNEIELKYGSSGKYTDTINVINIQSLLLDFEYDEEYNMIYDFLSSKNVKVNNNKIDALGHTLIYGIKISAEDFEVNENNLTIVSDTSYANGINIEGPSSNGVVNKNNLNISAPNNVYCIYTWGVYGDVDKINYTNNNIYGNAYSTCGIESRESNTMLSDNTFVCEGNYTVGICLSNAREATISKNSIVTLGNNNGTFPTGDTLLPYNSIGISIKGSAIISNNEIKSSSIGFNAVEDGTIVLKDNVIDVVANKGKVDNHAIVADEINHLTLTGNNVTYSGLVDYNFVVVDSYEYGGYTYYVYDTSKNAHAYGVYIKNTGTVIKNNNFDLAVPTFAVNWGTSRESFSEGIVLVGCDDVVFEDNNVDVTVNGGSSWDTVYGIDVLNSANPSLKNNNITVNGAGYTYGIIINDEKFTIENNDIKVTSDNMAEAIDVEGPAKGVINKNNITAIGVESTYPIYSGMTSGELLINITNNNIEGNAYYAVGIELAATESLIEQNTVNVNGNHTIGVATKVADVTINKNNINAFASNEGNTTVWDGMGTLNSAVKVIQGNATISGNKLSSNAIGINVDSTNNKVNIENNNINVAANSGKVDNYAIIVDDIDDLTIAGNNVTYSGLVDYNFVVVGSYEYGGYTYDIYDTSNNTHAYGVYIKNSNAVIKNNNFDLAVPTFAVNWGTSRESFSEGIVLVGCDDVVFEDNNVDVTVNGGSSWDTVYGIDVLNSANPSLKNNNITVNGAGYTYAIIINDEKFNIENNNINVSSDNYACGIDVEGKANGTIAKNTINTVSTSSAYPIYSGMNGQPVSIDIVDNKISGESYYVVGVEVGGTNALIENNEINVKGNHALGIGSSVDNLTVNDNTISVDASNEGNDPVWDSMGTDSTGVKVSKGNATISNNDIKTTSDSAVDLGDNNATVSNNQLMSNAGAGDDAIKGTGDINSTGNPVTNNPYLKVIIFANDLTKVEGSSDQFIAKIFDENGKVVSNKTIELILNGVTYTKVSDDKGQVALDVDLAAGNYTVKVKFSGDDKYGSKLAEANVVVTAKPATPKTTPKTTPVAKKVATKITAKKKTFKAKVKVKKYTIILKAGKNPVNKVKVTLKVKGKTYKATTNTKGKATFKIKNLKKKGKYTAVVKFAGKGNYKASSAKVKITVKK